MDFLELARRRVSVRGYKPDPVTMEQLAGVLEAARLAPTAANRQPWTLLVVRDPKRREALAQAYPRDWLRQAPLILALCVNPEAAWRRVDAKNYADVDGAIVMDHLTLAAADLGLGTCWIGAFDPAVVRAALELPAGIEPLALTPLGHSADAGRPKQRKPLTDLIREDHW